MSADKFEWTDELVKEFAAFYATTSNTWVRDIDLNTFKSHKTTKPKVEWEIVTCLASDGKSVHPYQEKRCLGADKHLTPCTIYTVRRLFDGEVFSIGDEVESAMWGNQIIVGFKIENWGMAVEFESCRNPLDKIKKVTKPKPLFRWVVFTEDGFGFDTWKVIDWGKDFEHPHCGVSVFNSKEAAENLIILHHPILALIDAHKIMFEEVGLPMNEVYKKMKELAKEKLSK
jgi:hypothetical protein